MHAITNTYTPAPLHISKDGYTYIDTCSGHTLIRCSPTHMCSWTLHTYMCSCSHTDRCMAPLASNPHPQCWMSSVQNLEIFLLGSFQDSLLTFLNNLELG